MTTIASNETVLNSTAILTTATPINSDTMINSTAQGSNFDNSTLDLNTSSPFTATPSPILSTTTISSIANDGSTTVKPNNSDISSGDESNDNDTNISEVECKNLGRFAHPSSCTKYYFCWDDSGWPREFKCPEHKAFDPISQRCVINYGVCAYAPKCKHHKQTIPNPDNRWSFFECFLKENKSNDFELRYIACADDRVYDDKFGYCKFLSANDERIVDSDEFIDDSICDKAGVFLDYEDDTRFYECVVKNVASGLLKAVHHKCPMYHIFSMHDRICIPLSLIAKPK